jgi:hypothetical protein
MLKAARLGGARGSSAAGHPQPARRGGFQRQAFRSNHRERPPFDPDKAAPTKRKTGQHEALAGNQDARGLMIRPLPGLTMQANDAG